MNNQGVPMLTDFGMSHANEYSLAVLNSTEASRDILQGTTAWLAYEILKGFEDDDAPIIYTPASDTWAFGMVLYVSMTELH